MFYALSLHPKAGQPTAEASVSARKYVEEFVSSGLPLHILVNNAGANHSNPWKTADGVPGLVQVTP